MSKKVFFQLVDTLAMGGTERMSINIGSVMDEEGWESHLIVSRKGGGLEAHISDGIQVHYLEKKSFYDVKAFWKLFQLVIKYHPTVFHAHSTSIYWAVLLKLLGRNFLMVWHDHFGLSDQLEKYPRKDIVILAKWIDKIITVNEKLELYWKNLLPYKVTDIETIGNFPFLRLPKSEKLPIFTFLNLANFRPQKDQLNLIEAATILSQEGYEYQILLIGEIVEQEWATRIKNQIKTKGLSKNIKFIGPSLDVAKTLSEVHSGILSSESEGLPVALLEYALAGLPIICTDVGDCRKVVSDPELGWLVPPNNPELLADAMKNLIDNKEKAIKIGQKIKHKVVEEYGEKSFLKSYFNLVKTERVL